LLRLDCSWQYYVSRLVSITVRGLGVCIYVEVINKHTRRLWIFILTKQRLGKQISIINRVAEALSRPH
jgi:hypothetical protein